MDKYYKETSGRGVLAEGRQGISSQGWAWGWGVRNLIRYQRSSDPKGGGILAKLT